MHNIITCVLGLFNQQSLSIRINLKSPLSVGGILEFTLTQNDVETKDRVKFFTSSINQKIAKSIISSHENFKTMLLTYFFNNFMKLTKVNMRTINLFKALKK